jgi:mannose-6-phosphate isomerase-like protein (cupin superfamily)
MSDVVNIEKCFARFSDTFSPKIVAELNGQHVKLVRVEGDKVPWHTHDDEDELFFVFKGTMDILVRGEKVTNRVGADQPATDEKGETVTEQMITLHAGEFYVVPRGVEHRIIPRGHVKLMLFEPMGIAHTGNVRAEITQDQHPWLE